MMRKKVREILLTKLEVSFKNYMDDEIARKIKNFAGKIEIFGGKILVGIFDEDR
jgi:uncharacterized membrane protein